MAFTQVQYFDGYNNGLSLSIYGQTVVSAGFPYNSSEGDIYAYKRDMDTEWSEIYSETVLQDSSNVYHKGCSIYNETIAFVAKKEDEKHYLYFRKPFGGHSVESGEEFEKEIEFEGDYDNIGNAIALNNNYVVISLLSSNTNQGKVIIYENQGGYWTEALTMEDSEIVSPYSAANDLFGYSVAINSNDIVFISAVGGYSGKGVVYVYEKDSSGWVNTNALLASNGAIGDRFGNSLSADGEYLIVGAENTYKTLTEEEYNGLSVESRVEKISYAGAVYVYKYNSFSGAWFEVVKIEPNGEDSVLDYETNYFGHSVCLNEDYLSVGSPGAKGKGVVDIFYKKTNWGHIQKIENEDGFVGDNFGDSVAIQYPYLSIGASGFDNISSDGRVYLYEQPSLRLKIAQKFNYDGFGGPSVGEYTPSKVSAFLQRSGANEGTSWTLSPNARTVIDSTNFISIEKGDNCIMYDDEITSHTGNGYIVSKELLPSGTFSVINYPVRSSEINYYNLWLRTFQESSIGGGVDFDIDILMDGINVGAISNTTIENEWVWSNLIISFEDTEEHLIGLRINQGGIIVDKLYLNTSDISVPEGEGPYLSSSPYVTVHVKIFDDDVDGFPNVGLPYIYDYKTSVKEIIQDDWYNFNIRPMNGVNQFSSNGDYFIVLSSSGGGINNFIQWATIDASVNTSIEDPNSFIKV